MPYLTLFLVSLIAATILPAQSEAVLSAMLLSGHFSPLLLVVVASVGNVLGSCVNWWLGTRIAAYKDRKWFPVREASLEKASVLFQRWGVWSLLGAWLPFVGDPLTVVAGSLRVPFIRFVVLVAIGKVGRYVALALALQ